VVFQVETRGIWSTGSADAFRLGWGGRRIEAPRLGADGSRMPAAPRAPAGWEARLRSLIVCVFAIAAQILVVFVLAAISRSDDYLSELAVSPGPWILVFLVPELILLGGAVAAGLSSPQRRWLVAARSGKLALVGVGFVAVWMLSSREGMTQAIWLVESIG
jgi:hypothetical protein